MALLLRQQQPRLLWLAGEVAAAAAELRGAPTIMCCCRTARRRRGEQSVACCSGCFCLGEVIMGLCLLCYAHGNVSGGPSHCYGSQEFHIDLSLSFATQACRWPCLRAAAEGDC